MKVMANQSIEYRDRTYRPGAMIETDDASRVAVWKMTGAVTPMDDAARAAGGEKRGRREKPVPADAGE